MFHVEHLHISKKYSTFAVTFILCFVFGAAGVVKFPPLFKRKEKMYKITKTEERVLLDAAEKGIFRQGDIGVLNSLMLLCGVRVANTLCSRCYVDAAIHCLYILRNGGYEVED